jgi:hypothetical protein
VRDSPQDAKTTKTNGSLFGLLQSSAHPIPSRLRFVLFSVSRTRIHRLLIFHDGSVADSLPAALGGTFR